MKWIILNVALFVPGLLALAVLGLPIGAGVGILAILYFLTARLFRWVGIAYAAFLLLEPVR